MSTSQINPPRTAEPLPVRDNSPRTFYLELARRLCTPPDNPDCENAWLWRLLTMTRKMIKLFSLLNGKTASDQITLIQRACSYFLMEDTIPKKERAQVVATLAAWSELFVSAAGLRPYVNLSLQEYVRRARELELMLRGTSPGRTEGKPESL